MDSGRCRNDPYLLYIGRFPENGFHTICKHHWDHFDEMTKDFLKHSYMVLKPREVQDEVSS